MSETIIHPETGAILRRRKRMETVTHQGQSRTVEVEGWFPDDEGDGILVGADSEPLDAALAEMKAGWPDPARPGVPLNPDRDGWHWLKTPDENDAPYEWRGSGECERGRWPAYWVLVDADNWQPAECTYIAPVLTPAEVEARVKQARRDGREEAARRILIYFNNNDIARSAAAAIRALGEKE
jgi:hypothetical protein